jgi:formylglycine-generating enzyme required for sulfatase activity
MRTIKIVSREQVRIKQNRIGQKKIAKVGATRAVNLVKALGVKMKAISAGEFIFQGVPGVRQKGFELAETPLTNGLFRKLLEIKPQELSRIFADPAELLDKSIKAAAYPKEAEDCPLVYITQKEAENIAQLLGLRLPAELEWERAAAYTDGRVYPFGNSFDEDKVAFHVHGTRSVFAHMGGASPEGVLDLSGNVSEWTSTPYGHIDLSDPKNPKLPRDGVYFVLRGGSLFCSRPDLLQSAYREIAFPDTRKSYIGVRFAGDL